MRFNHVVCGGTFDHLHKGHKKLLDECLMQGKKVTVGVTTKAMIRHKPYNNFIQSYATRVKNVSRYNSSFTFAKLFDIFGPTLTDTTIDAICVTKDTLSGAELINKKRIQLGMKALFIIMVPFAYDENGEKISSIGVRAGLINREGKRYDKYLFSKEQHILPDSLKEVLRNPLGRVISSFSALAQHKIDKMKKYILKQGYFYLCAVGDIVTFELKKLGITSFISIVDGMTMRKALNTSLVNTILERDYSNAINEKSTIQRAACIEIRKLFDIGQERAIKQLYIQGEEDLLTLVAILLAPLGTHIWYGQQGVGAIDVLVTEKKKERVYNLIQQFK